MNVLFHELKLTQATQQMKSSDILATHALLMELVGHFGGPRYILRVWPVAELNADTLKDMLLEAIQAIVSAGVCPLSIMCDNCPTNRSVYDKLGGPGEVYLTSLGIFVFVVFDNIHIFKNIRNMCSL